MTLTPNTQRAALLASVVALALLPSGNTGKGRYLLRVTAPQIQAEL